MKSVKIIPNTVQSINQKIEDLLEKGAIEEVSGKVFLNRMFEVPKRDTTEKRLVLDASHLNEYVQPYKFRMVSIKQVRLALKKSAYLAAIDLKDAYWHIPIHPRYRRFLAFL